jgi:hypothetical protein
MKKLEVHMNSGEIFELESENGISVAFLLRDLRKNKVLTYTVDGEIERHIYTSNIAFIDVSEV